MAIESDIKQKALDLGFDAVGITSAEPLDSACAVHFQQWLDAGCAGEMAYLHRNIEKRFDPSKLLTGARSVICVALNYRPECSRSILLRNGPRAVNAPKLEAPATLRIARFAQYEDYHPFIKDRLFQLAEFICRVGSAHAGELKFKACVDSVPIAERALAQRAGLGFIGRNHMLIHPELGSQILLGELITTLELQPDQPFEQIPCGDCGRCIRACPTGALGADGTFDARKCISYQTIEAPTGSAGVSPPHKQKLSPCEGGAPRRGEGVERQQGVSTNNNTCGRDARVPNYIFGCDECILACPHELGKPPQKNMDFQHHPEWQELTSDQILNMTEEEFQKIFANSGFIRLGLDRLKQNLP